MSWLKCGSCSGVYPTKEADLTLYFHVCPPSVAPGLRRNENPPSTDAASVNLIVSTGGGAVASVAPPGAPPGLAAL